MSLKAFAVTCERYYPGIVCYYAANSEQGAITAALFSMLKIGGRARRSDLIAMRSPEYDSVAATVNSQTCIDQLIEESLLV